MKENKQKEDKKQNKEKKPNKFIEIVKKKWLVDGSKTFLLVLIIIAIFLGINIGMQKLELTPIDFSQEQLFTLTEESKEKVKNIDKDVNIYFIGYTEEDTNYSLAKQYKKANEKITAEAIDISTRPDLATKYGIESGTQGIIVECGEKSKVLTASDLVTYDTSTYETISIAEQKLTSSILSVTANEVPKVYFLDGYSEFTLTSSMNYLNMFMQNEVMEVSSLDILTTGKIPDDCATLVITTPNKDFDDIATKAIKEYIESGRNILWLNAAVSKAQNFANVNSILALYGVNPFDLGVIRETDSSKMGIETPNLIKPDLNASTVTKDLYNSTGVILPNATKININEEALTELKVEKTELANASEGAYFRTNFNIQSNNAQEGEEKGPFLIGVELDKTIKEENEETEEKAVTSKLILFGENYFVTDFQLSQNSQYAAVQLAYNKDLVLNSIAYLTDREEDITARKSTGTVTYTATQEQDTIVKIIIFTIPTLIIIAGIIVWQVRRRKK